SLSISFSSFFTFFLGKQDLIALKGTKKKVKKLEKEIDKLKDNVYYFIKHLDDTSVEASKFYVHTLGYLQDTVQSLGYISQSCTTHVDNNHKKLKFNQIKDIKFIEQELNKVFAEVH